MSKFFDFDDSYTKTALVLGVDVLQFVPDKGDPVDRSRVSIYADLAGEHAVGGSATQMVWGTSANCKALASQNRIFPAMVELKIRKSAKGLGKELEEILDFKYLQPMRLVPVPAEGGKKAA